MSYLPPDSGLANLLSIIADESSVKQRITDLQIATDRHNKLLVEAQALQKKTQEDRRVFEGQVRQLQSDVTKHQEQAAVDHANNESSKRDIEASLRDIAGRNDNLRQREETLQTKARALDLATDQLRNREINVAARETKLLGREQHVDQHSQRHAALVDYLRNNGFINI